MAKIKPMELVSRLSGKLCSHSDIYFAERNGTQYTGKICNPYVGAPTEKQLAVREKFREVIQAMAELTEEQLDGIRDAFKNQKRYKTLRGYMFAEEYKKNNN